MKLLCNEWTRSQKWTRSPASDVGGDRSAKKGWPLQPDTRGGLPEETEPLGDQNKLQKDKRTVFQGPHKIKVWAVLPSQVPSLGHIRAAQEWGGGSGGGGWEGGQSERGRRGWQDTTSSGDQPSGPAA